MQGWRQTIYLARRFTVVGGSWFVPSAALDAGDFDEIRRLSCEAQALIPE